MEITGTGDNIYVTGSFNSASVTFGTSTLNNTGFSASDIFIVNLDTAGNTLWAHGAGSLGNDHANGISVDTDGNIYITGYFSGTAAFGSTLLTTAGANDIFLAKYNSTGNLQWAVRTGGTANEIGNSICNDAAGNSYIAGTFSSSNMTFANTPFSFEGGISDILILKYDSAGNESWGKFTGGSSSDAGFGICTDPAGNICATGQFNFTINFGSYILTTAGFLDIFIVKFDASGNVLWATRAGGSTGADVGYGIATDNISSTYITGHSASTSVSFGSSTLTTAGLNDIFIAKLDTSNVNTGIESLQEGIAISLKPNPASDHINIVASSITAIEIYNTLGEKIHHTRHISMTNKEYINVSAFSPGVYFVRVKTAAGVSVNKFVKE